MEWFSKQAIRRVNLALYESDIKSMSELTLKIHQGTGRSTGEPLCTSCSHCLHRNDEVWCTLYGERERIKSRVYSCNLYYNKSLPSIHDMRESAWTLRTEKGGKSIGFAPPKKRGADDYPIED